MYCRCRVGHCIACAVFMQFWQNDVEVRGVGRMGRLASQIDLYWWRVLRARAHRQGEGESDNAAANGQQK